jgi:hypothetical protein
VASPLTGKVREEPAMSKIDDKLAMSDEQITEIERQTNDLRKSAQSHPSSVSDRDVSLMERLLSGWKTLRQSVAKHPEFREREQDLEIKRRTGRAAKSPDEN